MLMKQNKKDLRVRRSSQPVLHLLTLFTHPVEQRGSVQHSSSETYPPFLCSRRFRSPDAGGPGSVVHRNSEPASMARRRT